MNTTTPIIVTGVARSGLPVASGILRVCGAWEGGTVGQGGRVVPVSDVIRRTMVEPFVKGLRADAKLQTVLPDIALCHRAADVIAGQWRRGVGLATERDGYTGGPWLYRGNDACLIWPVWRAAFPDALWVVVRRRDDEIVKACLRTHYMTGHTDAAGWQKWLDVHKFRIKEMIGAGLRIWQLWPADIMEGNLRQARDMVAAAGLDWNDTDVRDFISPVMWSSGVYQVTG